MGQHPRYLCIHGHFYQPPRENPWLEAVELQDSAHPFHDWNERISAECYGANARSRILDGAGRIAQITNNYERISFNMGPTLLAWLERHEPRIYRAILQADANSQQRFSGHGSALGQVYNHMIMPLANERDQRTQVRWGVADFRHRFGRAPEGMWLAETAVDLDSLEALAAEGVRYTILEPGQAQAIRPLDGSGDWQDASGGRIDPTRPYLQRLPSGREIVLFFYDGPISRGVAFEGLLEKGERLANRLAGALREGRDWPQLVHIATDGESYGHHHKQGDMALAYALQTLDEREDVELTNYGEYLERHPPRWEVRIVEDTSWSCAHGIERWRSDCGCNSGGKPGWHQRWRQPLREALDWLRDELAPRYEEAARELVEDPWRARDDYIEVLLDRDEDNRRRWLEAHGAAGLGEQQRVQLWKLLELQRHAMLMYTSCGWFFDELSGIETVQVIQYAARAVQLAREVFEEDLEPEFLERLERSESNLGDLGTGRAVYERYARPAAIDLRRVGAHYAISSLFDPREEEHDQIYSYEIEIEDRRMMDAGAARLVLGSCKVRSTITQESARFDYAALRFGEHNVVGGIGAQDRERWESLEAEAHELFDRADFPALIRLIDDAYGESFSLRTTFRDEQRRVLDRILEESLREAEALYEQLYQRRATMMRFLADLNTPHPPALWASAELSLNGRLRRLLEEEEAPDVERLRSLLDEAHTLGAKLDEEQLGYALSQRLARLADQALRQSPEDPDDLQRLTRLTELAGDFRADVDLWEAQNIYWEVLTSPEGAYAERRQAARGDDEESQRWVTCFEELGGRLGVNVQRQQREVAR